MTNPFVGEIRAYSFGFAPSGWLACAGQLLPINQYQALFALLGTTYGGNGTTNFALPDLRGRIALSMNNGYTPGQQVGTESVTLQTQIIPSHTHAVTASVNGATNATNVPGPTVILGSGTASDGSNPAVSFYNTSAPNVQLAPLSTVGSSQPHENRMPSLVINYCIAFVGIFPSRS